MTLLSAQWVGLKHRVVHSGAQGSSGMMSRMVNGGDAIGVVAVGPMPASAGVATGATFAVTVATGLAGKWDDQIHHSCAAFEAAALGAMLGCDAFVTPVLPNRHVLALWIAFASWQPPFTALFSSRAPPTA